MTAPRTRAALVGASPLATMHEIEGDHPFVAGLPSTMNDDPSLPDPDRLREDRDECRRIDREDAA